MKGYIFLLVLFLGSTSFADYNQKTLTTSERRIKDSVSDLQETFIDLVYGLSFDRKIPINTFAFSLTQRRFLYFLEETLFNYGNKNFLERVESLYKDLEDTLKITLDKETKQTFSALLLEHALPNAYYGDNKCPVFLLN